MPLSRIAAQFGTPCYVYSRRAIERQWFKFNTALAQQKHLICYAVKANSNLAVLSLLAELGSGFDIVSVGELERVLKAGGEAGKVVFSGVGKRTDEMQRALAVGIKCFNVESAAELSRLNEIAGALGKIAPVSLRVNPDVDAKTHPYIVTGLKKNKFGIPFADAWATYQTAAAMEHIAPIGIGCHIGSQIVSMAPFLDALKRLISLAEKIDDSGVRLRHIDIGGGLGICYQDEAPPPVHEYANKIHTLIKDSDYELILEPGRSIVGNAGILLTKVEYLKETPDKNFAIVDAAMNDLLRPALYNAWHNILPVVEPQSTAVKRNYEIVGCVCETGDFLGKQRSLSLQTGDLLAILSAGAYGFTMASTYNSRPRVCELMVDGANIYEIRKRETVAELMAGEQVLSNQET